MQKTFLKFIVFELVERIVRYRLLLNECADILQSGAPQLLHSLYREADALEGDFLSHKTLLNKLFNESGAPGGKQAPIGMEGLLSSLGQRLNELERLLIRMKPLDLEPETLLFLKDILPQDLTREAGEQSVFLSSSAIEDSLPPALLPGVLIDTLPVLQKNNPLGWVGLTNGFSRYLLGNASSLEALKIDLLKAEKKRAHPGLTESLVESLLRHAINLSLLGPAYYFHALSEAVFTHDESFLHFLEPALFFGMNHQNLTHKSLVIMHEACERSKNSTEKGRAETEPSPLGEDVLASIFRVIEKLLPAKALFQEKHLERAIQLQDRLSQGVMLSSSPLYPVGEVAEVLESTRSNHDFSIYAPLAMLTEYPHMPREIVNAGWLHKVERGPVWLYTILNEADPTDLGGFKAEASGFKKVSELLGYQDHLLRKSIEVSEVHRALLCGV
jgi:hypothetical protein